MSCNGGGIEGIDGAAASISLSTRKIAKRKRNVQRRMRETATSGKTCLGDDPVEMCRVGLKLWSRHGCDAILRNYRAIKYRKATQNEMVNGNSRSI